MDIYVYILAGFKIPREIWEILSEEEQTDIINSLDYVVFDKKTKDKIIIVRNPDTDDRFFGYEIAGWNAFDDSKDYALSFEVQQNAMQKIYDVKRHILDTQKFFHPKIVEIVSNQIGQIYVISEWPSV